MAFSPQEIQALEEWRRRDEEARLAQVAMVVNFARTWARCDRKECRRERGCADLNHCDTRYEKEILAWQREVLVPYLRERYPTVRWGAPASIAQVQLEAALEAEKDLSEAERSEKCGEALARIEARGQGEADAAATSAACAGSPPDLPGAADSRTSRGDIP